jgi:ornithine lipid hydroxylase
VLGIAALALIYPALLGAIAFTATTAPDWAWFGGPSGVSGLPLVALLAVFYPTVALLERWRPYRATWVAADTDLRADAMHLALTGPLSNAAFEATIRGLALAAGLRVAAATGGSWWPTGWPMFAQLFLAIGVAEFGHYWFHRVTHERALPWRLHATHHSARRLYWLNATRFHPLDLLALLTVQATPLLLLGIPERTYASYAIFAALYGQLQHCNIDVRTGRWIDWLFSTPVIHRWHHSRDPREGNNNYGAILNLWDHAFGTYFRPATRAFDGPVGIDRLTAFPVSYVAQLASPWRWRRIVADSHPAPR